MRGGTGGVRKREEDRMLEKWVSVKGMQREEGE